MTLQHDPADRTVATLMRSLVDNGRDYVRAEVDVARETVRARVASARVAIAVGVAAIFFVQAGLTVLFMALGSALAPLVGIWAGQLIAAVTAFAIAGIMVKYAISHISPPAADMGKDA
jgi:hypothetical protein